jgi:hypothetical protein
MEPEEFSTLGMYGQREFFERKRQEGYSKVAFGVGEWVNNQRIAAIFVFYHPTRIIGSITTLQHPQFDDGCQTIRAKPCEKKYYTKLGFNGFVKSRKIQIGDKQNLVDLLQNWDSKNS